MIRFFWPEVSLFPLLMMSSQYCDSLITFSTGKRRADRRERALALAFLLIGMAGLIGSTTVRGEESSSAGPEISPPRPAAATRAASIAAAAAAPLTALPDVRGILLPPFFMGEPLPY